MFIGELNMCWPWNHDWKIIREGSLTDNKEYIGYYYNLQCNDCGYVIRREFL